MYKVLVEVTINNLHINTDNYLNIYWVRTSCCKCLMMSWLLSKQTWEPVFEEPSSEDSKSVELEKYSNWLAGEYE